MAETPAVETPKKFALRTGLPERLVRAMVRQGQLPHIKTGKSHALIHIEAALDALRARAEQTAEEIAARLPVPLPIVPASRPRKQLRPKSERKYRGRPPDSVRLAKKEAKRDAEQQARARESG